MFRSTLLAACSLLAMGVAHAQAPGTGLSIGQVRVQDADLAGGGQVTVDTTQLSFSHSWNFSQGSSVGLQLRADREDWSFDNPAKSGVAPWGKVDRYGLGVPYMHGIGDGWQLMLTPRAEWAKEEGASSGDAMSWGLVGGGFKVFGQGQRIGFGLALARTLDEDTEVFPFVVVDWRFNNRWRLFNPSGLGLSGPGGLEVSYRLVDTIELGLGASWRTSRFRLANDNGLAAKGVGRFGYVPVFLHLSWKPLPSITLDAYGGMVLNGRLRIDDHAGNTVYKEDLANTPAFGVAANFRF